MSVMKFASVSVTLKAMSTSSAFNSSAASVVQIKQYSMKPTNRKVECPVHSLISVKSQQKFNA